MDNQLTEHQFFSKNATPLFSIHWVIEISPNTSLQPRGFLRRLQGFVRINFAQITIICIWNL